MAQKLQIEVEANLSGYTASLKEAAQDNVELSDSAKKSAAEVSAAYKQVGQVQRAAFGGEETKKALANQTSEIERLRNNLEKLYKEEIQLLSSGKKLTDEYKKNREEAAKVRAEFDKLLGTEVKRNQEIDKTTNKTVKLTTQLRDLKQQLSLLEQQGQSNTKEFEQIAIAAAKLEDQIGDTQERIKVLSSDTFVFDAAIDSVNALAGGFAVAQGAIGLFAEDNEELQRAIAKTNSALAILNGLQQIQAFVTGQSAGKLALLSIAQRAYTTVVAASTSAIKALQLALATIGIGALIALIGALVFVFNNLNDASSKTPAILQKIGERIRDLQKDAEVLRIRLKVLNGELTEGQAKGINKLNEYKDALKNDLIPIIVQRTELERKLAKLEELAASDRTKNNKDAARITAQSIKDTIAEIAKVDEEQKKLIAQSRSNLVAELQIINKESENSSKKTATIVRQLFESVALDIRQGVISLEQGIGDVSIDIAKTYESTLTSIRVARIIAETKLIGEENNLTKKGLDNRLSAIGLFYTEQEIIANQTIKNEEERAAKVLQITKESEEAKRAEIQRTRDAIIAQSVSIVQGFQQSFSAIFALTKQLRDNQISELEEQKQYELELVGNNLQARERIEKKYAQERRKLEREQAVAQKNQAIFQAVIDTAVAVVKALTSGGIIGPILAAAAGIAGAAQIATIASTPLPKLERGGRIGGRRHVQGGTIIEAEKDEFVVSRTPAIKHSRELEAMNRSSRDYMSYIDKAYVRPAVMDAILTVKRDEQKVNVNATLDSRRMENELRSLRRESKKGNKMLARALQTNSNDRYSW